MATVRIRYDVLMALFDLGTTSPKRWDARNLKLDNDGKEAPPVVTRSLSVGIQRLFDLVDPAVLKAATAGYEAQYQKRVEAWQRQVARKEAKTARHNKRAHWD
jgi:hypothetical protein